MRRNVRGIRLQDQRLGRQLRGEAADLQGPVEGQRAAEAQLEAKLEEGVRLLAAAIERMTDAAGPQSDAAQAAQQRVGAASHMEDHRQLMPLRELELLHIEMLLRGRVEVLDEEIEADLADADQARIVAALGQHPVETAEVLVARVHDVQRMDAQRIAEAMRMRERPHLLEVPGDDRRDHDLRHARCQRARDDGVAVDVELRGVEVAVRVSPHGDRWRVEGWKDGELDGRW